MVEPAFPHNPGIFSSSRPCLYPLQGASVVLRWTVGEDQCSKVYSREGWGTLAESCVIACAEREEDIAPEKEGCTDGLSVCSLPLTAAFNPCPFRMSAAFLNLLSLVLGAQSGRFRIHCSAAIFISSDRLPVLGGFVFFTEVKDSSSHILIPYCCSAQCPVFPSLQLHILSSSSITVNSVSPGLCFSHLRSDGSAEQEECLRKRQEEFVFPTEEGSRRLVHGGVDSEC
ncbi:hypothetical protein IW261DRAFT_1067208 [Armillaria novae-zelandiae]|uniref:Uncharacterized protein n=1 Tax=Armillaria novae-zelandiae TaxID=153914 RepID=A0AA39PBQ4_9AGAR|nr:hypothetical protein IW261DRAFT_1067208 [Armillaria novae-zelandiae]